MGNGLMHPGMALLAEIPWFNAELDPMAPAPGTTGGPTISLGTDGDMAFDARQLVAAAMAGNATVPGAVSGAYGAVPGAVPGAYGAGPGAYRAGPTVPGAVPGAYGAGPGAYGAVPGEAPGRTWHCSGRPKWTHMLKTLTLAVAV